MNKDQFLYQLQQNLQPLDPKLIQEILADFEEHFADGLAQGLDQEQLAEELGDPAEIARQYRESIAEGQSHQDVRSSWLENGYVHSEQQPVGLAAQSAANRQNIPGRNPADEPVAAPDKINEPMLVLVIVLNLLIGIPLWFSLFSTLFGFWAAAGGIGLAACALFVVALFEAGTVGLILFLFGLSLAALTIIGIIAMVYLTKALGLLLGHYIRWNKKLVTGGANA